MIFKTEVTELFVEIYNLFGLNSRTISSLFTERVTKEGRKEVEFNRNSIFFFFFLFFTSIELFYVDMKNCGGGIPTLDVASTTKNGFFCRGLSVT